MRIDGDHDPAGTSWPDVYVAAVGGGYLVMVRPHEDGGHVAGPLLSTLAQAERDGARPIAALRARRVTPCWRVG